MGKLWQILWYRKVVDLIGNFVLELYGKFDDLQRHKLENSMENSVGKTGGKSSPNLP